MLSRYTGCWCLRTTDRYKQFVVGATVRRFVAEAKLKDSKVATAEVNLENARPFEEIPGPSAFAFIRGILPGGMYYNKSFTEMINIMQKQYGPLIRMPGVLGKPDLYFDLNPDDYPIIFRNEGQWPYRRGLDTVNYYRQVHRRDFFQGVEGIVSTSGEKWAKVRTVVNPVLMQPKNVILYLNTMQEVNDEFLARIREIRDPITQEMPDNFHDEINRLTLESVTAVALNTQLGLIRKNRDSPDARILIDSLRKFFDLAYDLDLMPSIWKIIKTPKFREMMKTLDNLTDIFAKYINEALERIEDDHKSETTTEVGKEKSVLEKLSNIDKKIAVVMALDMLLAGVDTTSSTLTGILFCIAKNPEKQEKLFEEVIRLLPEKNSHLSADSMRNMPYLRASIKEGMRMYPIIAGTLRRLPHDLVLSGYRVRKGADVAINSNLLLNNGKYVPKAKTFLPERWLRDEGEKDLTGEIADPFIYLPFGFGPRSCVGKRIVDMELDINVARLVRNFKIEYNYPLDNPFKSKMIEVPAVPLKFKLEERMQ